MTTSRSQVLGIDYTTTYTSNTAITSLGDQDRGDDGTMWKFVRAGAAISQYQYVTIDENHEAVPGTATAVKAGHSIGFAQSAIANDQHGWVAVSGTNIKHNVLKSCAADADLYATASAGFLDDAVTTGQLIHGVVAVTAATSGAGGAAVEIIATFPHAGNATEPSNAG